MGFTDADISADRPPLLTTPCSICKTDLYAGQAWLHRRKGQDCCGQCLPRIPWRRQSAFFPVLDPMDLGDELPVYEAQCAAKHQASAITLRRELHQRSPGTQEAHETLQTAVLDRLQPALMSCVNGNLVSTRLTPVRQSELTRKALNGFLLLPRHPSIMKSVSTKRIISLRQPMTPSSTIHYLRRGTTSKVTSTRRHQLPRP